MWRNRKFWLVLALVAMLALALAACGKAEEATQAPATEAPATEEAQPTEATQEPTEEPTEAPTPTPTPEPRFGAWVDEVVVSTFDQEQAIARLKAGEADIYADTLVDPDVYNEVVNDPDLEAATAVTGKSVDIHVNPTEFQEGFNPFTDQKIREALHYLLNREYAAKEIHGGLAYPKYTALSVNLPEYVGIIDTVKALEAKYKYNPEKGKAIIAERMEALGATLNDEGKWEKDGEPVVIHFIIRQDLWKNKEIGDMFANELENAGFTVDRMYKTRDEAAPIVFGSDPTEGTWHLYIGGWGAEGLARDESWVWGFFYTNLGLGVPLWQAYDVPEEPFSWAEALYNGTFTSVEERTELMRKAAEFFTAWNTHLFVVELPGFQPYRKGIQVAYDLAAGIGSSDLWPYTIRWADKVGGTVKFGQKSVFVEPWNPVDGSNWAYDMAVQAATNDKGVFLDPYTGLSRPQRIEKAEVIVQSGTPVMKTYDWVDLQFADKIEVPGDAWVDWDAENQRWITAEEAGITEAKMKTVVYYPEGMFDAIKWHDGSNLSVADFVYNMILTFDRGKEASPLYDEAAASNLESYLKHFRGVRIVSTDPLIIETYDDGVATLDAENLVATWWPQNATAWHLLSVAAAAEANGELAFSADKADAKEVEQTSFIGGPSLEILKKYLDDAAANNTIPYENVLKDYISADEAQARYANLAKFYDEYGHFWIGTGPFILSEVDFTNKTAVLRRYEDYPDPADKWAIFGTPMLAEVEIDGDGQVVQGQDAMFDVYVTFQGEPYPADQITKVIYLVFDENGNLQTKGEAEMVEEGTYQVVIPGDVTAEFAAGSLNLQVAAVSKAVAVPGVGSFDFVVVAP